MSITRTYRCLAISLILGLLAPIVVEAAGLGVTVHRIDSSQFPKVQAYLSVANDQGVRIADLEMDPQAFELFEDDKPITGFQVEPFVASQEQVAVALVIDVSGSMNDEGKMEAAKQAASAFVDTMGAKDGAALISFSSDVRVAQPYTADKAALKAAIAKLAAKGETVLYDAVAESAQAMSLVQEQRKVLLLLTDGEDATSKKASLDSAIAAAKAAKTPVFAVGLGSGVKRDVLDKLATSAGGQAIYVARPDQLRQVFLSLGDQLRLQYRLQYTSKLPGDDKAHTLTVKVKYRGQTGEAKGTFVAKSPPLVADVKGLANAAKVTGTQSVEVVAAAGSIQEVELLVDGQSRGKTSTAPFTVKWDTEKEKPGVHRVVVRIKDAAGATTDKEFVVEVVGAAPPTPAPTVAPSPTPAPARPTAKPVPTPAPAPPATTGSLLYLAAGIVVVAVVGGGAAGFLLLRRRKPAPPPPPPVTAPSVVDDRTEAIGRPLVDGSAGGEVTAVGGGVAATVVHTVPRARLRIVHQGAEREVVLDQPETILGRETSNPIVIRDPMASRRHAKIVIEDGEFWIEDLKSLNGTRVNGDLITRRKLASNDQIKIGDALLTFVAEQG